MCTQPLKTKMPGASKLKWARRDWACLLPGILYTKSLVEEAKRRSQGRDTSMFHIRYMLRQSKLELEVTLCPGQGNCERSPSRKAVTNSKRIHERRIGFIHLKAHPGAPALLSPQRVNPPNQAVLSPTLNTLAFLK